ncbi:MAG: hypothetical protein EB059_08255 [Alphaproteobacteria bacterium]|nr:hypothetical protein [Alphaproteobacteria bacterium]
MHDPRSSSISIILTGGTIGAVLLDHSTRVEAAGNDTLRTRIAALTSKQGFDVQFHQLLCKASEDFDMPEWHAIASKVDELINQGCKRFLITHGTDTLPFTATMLQLLFAKRDISIALAAAFYPLADARSDAIPNLTAAMALLTDAQFHAGVYVPFRGTGQEVLLHHAMHVKQMAADAGGFDSFYGAAAGIYKELTGLSWANQNVEEIKTDFKVPSQEAMVDATRHVYFLGTYPGLNLLPYHALARKNDILLVIRNYHSGTANSSDGHGSIAEFIKTFPESLVAFSPLPAALVTKPYESTLNLMRMGAYMYRDLPVHKLYVLGLLGIANGLSPHAALAPAQNWLLNSIAE